MVAGNHDQRFWKPPEELSNGFEISMRVPEIAGANTDVDFRSPIQQPLSGASVAMQIAEEQEFHGIGQESNEERLFGKRRKSVSALLSAPQSV